MSWTRAARGGLAALLLTVPVWAEEGSADPTPVDLERVEAGRRAAEAADARRLAPTCWRRAYTLHFDAERDRDAGREERALEGARAAVEAYAQAETLGRRIGWVQRLDAYVGRRAADPTLEAWRASGHEARLRAEEAERSGDPALALRLAREAEEALVSAGGAFIDTTGRLLAPPEDTPRERAIAGLGVLLGATKSARTRALDQRTWAQERLQTAEGDEADALRRTAAAVDAWLEADEAAERIARALAPRVAWVDAAVEVYSASEPTRGDRISARAGGVGVLYRGQIVTTRANVDAIAADPSDAEPPLAEVLRDLEEEGLLAREVVRAWLHDAPGGRRGAEAADLGAAEAAPSDSVATYSARGLRSTTPAPPLETALALDGQTVVVVASDSQQVFGVRGTLRTGDPLRIAPSLAGPIAHLAGGPVVDLEGRLVGIVTGCRGGVLEVEPVAAIDARRGR